MSEDEIIKKNLADKRERAKRTLKIVERKVSQGRSKSTQSKQKANKEQYKFAQEEYQKTMKRLDKDEKLLQSKIKRKPIASDLISQDPKDQEEPEEPEKPL